MDKIEFYDKERQALREELVQLRNQQIAFLTTSITTTGLVLGIATTLVSTPNLGVVFLFPLTVLLPSWWIFFDKATTISRIVGYYRILENLILGSYEAENFVGWENAIDRLRDQMLRGKLKFQKEKNTKHWFSQLFEMFVLRTGNRYWVLCYYIFLGLSSTCIMVSIATLPNCISVVSAPTVLTLISIIWNARLLWQLIYEKHSYDYYEHCWAQILSTRINNDK